MAGSRDSRGFTLVQLLVGVVVVAGVVALGVTVTNVGVIGAGGVVRASLELTDQAAAVVHNSESPTITSDGNDLIWTHRVTGRSSEINSFQVGPIPLDVRVRNITVDVSGWTGTLSNQFITFVGPGNVRLGDTATASFRTSADASQTVGVLKALIFVDVVPATRGVRPSTASTLIPAFPR